MVNKQDEKQGENQRCRVLLLRVDRCMRIATLARGLTKKGRRRRPFVTDRERRAKRFAV
jgi:hypothetical protein